MHPKHSSPLRYPGGKASLSGFLTDVIDLNDLRGCAYYEPYAGGAGAALNLLKTGTVREIHINDADERVFLFWKAALEEGERFIDRILEVPLTIQEWHRQRAICDGGASPSKFDVGFATFYMNRCNRSGVLTGAGPIGGFSQTGNWKLNARFTREALAERFRALGKLGSQIHISNRDALEFLKKKLPAGQGRKNVFVYLDPPYVGKGQRLYLNAYDPKDHASVARYLRRQNCLPWLLSYDDDPLIRSLYSDQRVFNMPIRYSLQKKMSAKELVICPPSLSLPRSCEISGIHAALSFETPSHQP
jgi:DNA adenine methylase